MKKFYTPTILGAVLLCFSASASAFAARAGTVDIEGTELHQFPDKTSVVLIKLHKGTRLAASNVPTLGFHKVRLRSSLVGWVLATSLVLQPLMTVTPPTVGNEGGSGDGNEPGGDLRVGGDLKSGPTKNSSELQDQPPSQ